MDLAERTPLNATSGWKTIFAGQALKRLETLNLPEFLPKQRWFAGKSRHMKSTRIVDWAALDGSQFALAFVEVQFEAGPADTYVVPLAMTFGEAATELQHTASNSIVTSIISGKESGLLHDGMLEDEACLELLSLIERERELHTQDGVVRGSRGKSFQEILGSAAKPLTVRRSSAEQSNTSIFYGDRLILKLFRRIEPGLNPDAEIGRYLTEKATFDHIPPFAGTLEFEPGARAEPATLAMLQGLVANEGDGWKWTVEELERYFESRAPLRLPEEGGTERDDPLDLSGRPLSQEDKDHLGIYFDAATRLGRRTAELHLALGSPSDDPAFSPEPVTPEGLQALLQEFRQNASRALDVLKERVSYLPDEVVEIAAAALSRRRRILDHFGALKSSGLGTQLIRIHGDYHLGQVLRVKTDFVILDFEGEPARSLSYRRAKQCPLKDVAGMLRSFSYAAYASLFNYAARHPEDIDRLEPWAQLWQRLASAAFLHAYREASRGADFLPTDDSEFQKLLDVFLLDKALYEVLYELNARPAWLRIPLMGIMSLPL
jgi:maltose alpha-D-glucosyltransferase/alpha-amylase